MTEILLEYTQLNKTTQRSYECYFEKVCLKFSAPLIQPRGIDIQHCFSTAGNNTKRVYAGQIYNQSIIRDANEFRVFREYHKLINCKIAPIGQQVVIGLEHIQTLFLIPLFFPFGNQSTHPQANYGVILLRMDDSDLFNKLCFLKTMNIPYFQKSQMFNYFCYMQLLTVWRIPDMFMSLSNNWKLQKRNSYITRRTFAYRDYFLSVTSVNNMAAADGKLRQFPIQISLIIKLNSILIITRIQFY